MVITLIISNVLSIITISLCSVLSSATKLSKGKPCSTSSLVLNACHWSLAPNRLAMFEVVMTLLFLLLMAMIVVMVAIVPWSACTSLKHF